MGLRSETEGYVERGSTARGSFIVLEGTDGSGKGTQLELLAQRLSQAGHEVTVFDFPQYELPSSYFVKRYLNGDYGSATDVGPYTGALFYALDRYDVAEEVRRALDDGKIVLANRYTASSMAHQGAKFDNAEQRRGYFIWLDNLEFETLRIPRPDLNIVLRVPAETAQQLVDKKAQRSYTDKKRDLHEADIDHLRLAVSVYDDLCQLFPKDFTRIDCVRSGELLDIETVNKLVSEKVAPLLPEPKPRQANATIELPLTVGTEESIAEEKPEITTSATSLQLDDLDTQTRRLYYDTMDELDKHYQELLQSLTNYLNEERSNNLDEEIKTRHQQLAAATLEAVRPIALREHTLVGTINSTARALLDSLKPSSHSTAPDAAVTLVGAAPRNELDLVPQLLYAHSNLPYRELLADATDWNYEQKAKILTLTLNDLATSGASNTNPADTVIYTWEFVSDYGLFLELYQLSLGSNLAWQVLTPRLGFEVPKLIDDAGLTELYEECFDLSLRLYSQLQQKGYDHQAQYAILVGHKLRWSIQYTVGEIQKVWQRLDELDEQPLTATVRTAMQEKLSEIHPLIAETLGNKKV